MARDQSKVIVLNKTVTKKDKTKHQVHEMLFSREEQANTVQNLVKHFLANKAPVISRHLDSCSLWASVTVESQTSAFCVWHAPPNDLRLPDKTINWWRHVPYQKQAIQRTMRYLNGLFLHWINILNLLYKKQCMAHLKQYLVNCSLLQIGPLYYFKNNEFNRSRKTNGSDLTVEHYSWSKNTAKTWSG